jgi:hypothetical protein
MNEVICCLCGKEDVLSDIELEEQGWLLDGQWYCQNCAIAHEDDLCNSEDA